MKITRELAHVKGPHWPWDHFQDLVAFCHSNLTHFRSESSLGMARMQLPSLSTAFSQTGYGSTATDESILGGGACACACACNECGVQTFHNAENVC